jgi:hypothetical protein
MADLNANPQLGETAASDPAHMRAYKTTVGVLGRNPKAVLYGILILVIMILSFALYRCHKPKKTGFEGLVTNPTCPPCPACPPRQYVVADGGTGGGSAELDNDGGLGSDPTGKRYGQSCPEWDPEATAEVQALGQVGGFEDDNAYGERRLQNAFGHVVTDAELNAIMMGSSHT